MRKVFLVYLLIAISSCISACDDEVTPCTGETCSGHGTCHWTQDQTPYCECDEGYLSRTENPLACWEIPQNVGKK